MTMVDIEAVQQHARFFDHLVELIPAKHYHDDADERVDLKSMKKAARAAMKQQFKAKAKENKRNKLDPDAPATALEVQQQNKAGTQNKSENLTAPGSSLHTANLSGASLSREELKSKLQQKLEAQRQQRNQKDKQALAQQAKEWRKKALSQGQQPQTNAEQSNQSSTGKRKADNDLTSQPNSKKQPQQPQPSQQSKQQPKQQNSNPGQKGGKQTQEDGDFQFARVEFEDNKGKHGKHQGKKPTKEQLIRAAEAKQAELAAAAATGEQGKVAVVQEAWKAALARAGGEKVLDDPKLLKKSLKKEAKRKEKSAKAWQERKRAQQEQQDKRQNRRTENLQARVDKKIEKKKERREKKLLRAGFEGRKAGFIGDKAPSKAAAPKDKAAA